MDEEPFDASTFFKNRERLLKMNAARAFLAEVVTEARRRRLLSPDAFTSAGRPNNLEIDIEPGLPDQAQAAWHPISVA